MSDIPRGLSGKRRLNVRAAVLGVRCISESHERRYALFGIVAASHMGAGLDIGDKSAGVGEIVFCVHEPQHAAQDPSFSYNI